MSARGKKAGSLPDAEARRLAVSTFDRTVVVTAGAGTGKTALLTSRILRILMHPGEATAGITEIAAITFTRRAAGEMRVRIREALLSFAGWAEGTAPAPAPEAGPLAADYAEVAAELDSGEIRRRALEALEHLERAVISTMHSFAGLLIREHPAAAGIDPAFSEDDGTEFEARFAAAWRRFLSAELGAGAPRRRAARWNALLDSAGLEDLAGLARALADETVDLDALKAQLADGRLFEPDAEWLGALLDGAEALWEEHDRSTKLNPGKILRSAVGALRALAAGGGGPDSADLEMLEKKARPSKAWSKRDADEVNRLAGAAREVAAFDPEPLRAALELLMPFARSFRGDFARAGFLSFSALLVRARDLLRDHRGVREAVRRRFRHVLVDEFQDTDPLQYEIVYFLCGLPGDRAADWRAVKVQPGKLFIVGDPKQSIYSFRGADIAAYGHVVGEALPEPAERLRLETNFRSRAPILETLNGVFSGVIRPRPGVQPEYEALAARPGADAPDSQRVELRLARTADGGKFHYAGDAVRAEARSLARWIGEELVGRREIGDAAGRRPVRFGDIAVLLRKLTDLDEYVDALRAEGLPFAVEGEKSFFAAEEVRAFIALISAAADPLDAAALAGALRSPVGGMTDRDLAVLARARRLDYVSVEKLPAGLSDAGGAEALFARLRGAHARIGELPLPAAVDLLLGAFPVLESAEAFGGEGAAANLEKVRRMAVEVAADGETGLRGFVRLLRRSSAELVEEGENPLAEEGQNAIRLLTVHKAKGLEFPVVVLAGLHSGITPRGSGTWVRSEWTRGAPGVSLAGMRNPEAVRIESREEIRRDAEERRVFYVGATRARELLVLSAAPIAGSSRGRHRPLDFLAEVLPLPEAGGGGGEIPAGPGRVLVTEAREPEAGTGPGRAAAKAPAAAELKLWAGVEAARRERLQRARTRAVLLRPSSAHEMPASGDETFEGETHMPLVGRRRERAVLLGTLAHAVMERLEFSGAADDLERCLAESLDEHAVELGDDREELADELRAMLGSFVASPAFAELRGAKVLAREIPCVCPWRGEETGGGTAAVEGVIDLVCESGGRTLVVDYKTDSVPKRAAEKHAESYRRQGAVYVEAVRRATGREVETFRVVFLRPCVVVDLAT
ncbi:MAG: UvrD-helicase domain-containing protein [Planctomycetota bacterium]